jgi:DNA-binding MarR family transcriptional regulator
MQVKAGVEARDVLRAYLDAVALLESVQSRIWQSSQLTLGQARALRRLAAKPLSLSQLAAELSLSATSATRLVDRLEERGLVERVRSGDDRRVVVVSVRPAGRRLLGGLPTMEGTDIKAAVESMTNEERATVMEALRLLTDRVRAVEAAR